MAEFLNNPPIASYLVRSLRSTGYNFGTAVADIIDNSISAGAKHIDLYYPASPDRPYLVILDDGCGMSREEIIKAMRFGSNPFDAERKEGDLGRFGLGLKTASISQCRKLTVLSKKDGELNAMCWDLKLFSEDTDWRMQVLSPEEIRNIPYCDYLDYRASGTIVLWEDFDILSAANLGMEYKALCDAVATLHGHLGLVFHRFLDNGPASIEIRINNRPLPHIDPFLRKHKKTEEAEKVQRIPIKDEKMVSHDIVVTSYVLPFIKDLTEEDYETLGGQDSLVTKQGFYVYRNRRLIVYGTWFGMRPSSSLAKYGRIQVDIPSALDKVWKIDVKKQRAELPPGLKLQLRELVEKTTLRSGRKSTYRGASKKNDYFSVWSEIVQRDKSVLFRIKRDSPLVEWAQNELDDNAWTIVEMLLTSIENSIPYTDIYTHKDNETISTEISDEEKEAMVEHAYKLFVMLSGSQHINDEALLEKTIGLLNYTSSRDWLIPMIKNKAKENYND